MRCYTTEFAGSFTLLLVQINPLLLLQTLTQETDPRLNHQGVEISEFYWQYLTSISDLKIRKAIYHIKFLVQIVNQQLLPESIWLTK